MSRRTEEAKAHHDVRGTLGNLIACGDLLLDPTLSRDRVEALAKLVRRQAQAALDRFDLLAPPSEAAGEEAWCPLAIADLLQFASTAARESVETNQVNARIEERSVDAYWKGDPNFLGLISRECCRRFVGQSTVSSVLVSCSTEGDRIELSFIFELSSRTNQSAEALQFPKTIMSLLEASGIRLSITEAGRTGFSISVPAAECAPGGSR